MDGNPHLTIGHRLRPMFQMQMYEGSSPTYEVNGLQYGKLTICL